MAEFVVTHFCKLKSSLPLPNGGHLKKEIWCREFSLCQLILCMHLIQLALPEEDDKVEITLSASGIKDNYKVHSLSDCVILSGQFNVFEMYLYCYMPSSWLLSPVWFNILSACLTHVRPHHPGCQAIAKVESF